MDRFYTLRELETLLHLSPSTLRDRIREGRLDAVKRYRGGDRDDPRSWRWLVGDEEVRRFFQNELAAFWTAREHGRCRVPGFIRRGAKGRLLSPAGN